MSSEAETGLHAPVGDDLLRANVSDELVVPVMVVAVVADYPVRAAWGRPAAFAQPRR